jgi:hypothetical protein
MTMAKTKRFGRLMPEVLEFLRSQPEDNRVKGSAFYYWLRHTRKQGGSEHWWGSLRNGGPAPQELIGSFQAYLLENRKYRPEGAFSVEAEPVRAERPYHGWSVPTASGWARFLGWLTKPFALDEAAHCANESDILLAATWSIEWIGRLTVGEEGASLSEADARSRGEREMHRSIKEFAGWLLAIWQKAPDSILFATASGKRIGVNIMLPLTPAAGMRFSQGKVWDFHLTAEDIEAPSNNLVLFMVAESKVTTRKFALKSLSQITMMWAQLGLLSPSEEGLRPSIIGIAGTPESQSRLEKYGFVFAGAEMPITPRKLLVLSPETSREFNRNKEYESMLASVRLARNVMGARRLDLDEFD